MQGEKISFYRNFFSNTSYKLNLTTNEAYSHRNFFSIAPYKLEPTTNTVTVFAELLSES